MDLEEAFKRLTSFDIRLIISHRRTLHLDLERAVCTMSTRTIHQTIKESIDLSESSPDDWRYLSEGGSTIVFSYIGPPHPAYSSMVLRVRKSTAPGSHLSEHASEQMLREDDSLSFNQTVIRRLFDSDFLPLLLPAHVSRDWLLRLAESAESWRPQERRDSGGLDVTECTLTLATDLVSGQGLVVEIKPKWGFLPNPKYLSDISRLLKTRTCRTCMRQNLFCPLDLYSGEPRRVRRALEGLWDSWYLSNGTRNNLRIFVAGKMVRPNALASLSDILGHNASSTTISGLRDLFIDALLPRLSSSPVLRLLSTLQRSLDALDIEGLAKLYEGVRGKPLLEFAPNGEREPTTEEWKSFIDAFFARQEVRSEDEMKINESTLRYHILAYVLSATVKDCSLMLRIPTHGAPSPFTIKVIDLDIKDIRRLTAWLRLDMDVVVRYASVPENDRKFCVDSWS